MSTTHPKHGGQTKSTPRRKSRAGRIDRSAPVLIRLPYLHAPSPVPVSDDSTTPATPQEQSPTASDPAHVSAAASAAPTEPVHVRAADPQQATFSHDSRLWQGMGYKAGLSIALIFGTIGMYVLLAGGSSGDPSMENSRSDWRRDVDYPEAWVEADDGLLDGKISIEMPPADLPRTVAAATNEPEKEPSDRDTGSFTKRRDEADAEDLPELLGPQRPGPESDDRYRHRDDSLGNVYPYTSDLRMADQHGNSSEADPTWAWPSENNHVPDLPVARDSSQPPLRYPDTGKQEYDLVPHPRSQRQAQLPGHAYPMPPPGSAGGQQRGALHGTIQNPEIRPNYERTGSGLY